MKIVIQRVARATVRVEGEIAGSIDRGLLLLVGFGKGDTEKHLLPVINKVLNMRIFPNEAGKFDRSVLDVDGEILVVSQFTLFADLTRGRRPEFIAALPPEEARELYDRFLTLLRESGITRVESGVFGAMMKVELENDGPVTILLDSSQL